MYQCDPAIEHIKTLISYGSLKNQEAVLNIHRGFFPNLRRLVLVNHELKTKSLFFFFLAFVNTLSHRSPGTHL